MKSLNNIKQIIRDKVSGVWVSAHDGSGHRYQNTITGDFKRSVTTILGILQKEHLMSWVIDMAIKWLQVEDRWEKLQNEHFKDEMVTGAKLAHTDIRDDAGHVGTQAHDAVELYLKEWIDKGYKPVSIVSFAKNGCDSRAIASMRAVQAFLDKHDIEPIYSELLVGDDRYSAGTLDFLCLMDGKLTLIDWKTSNSVDAISYSMQVAAYKYFFEKMSGLKIKQCKILHLSKDYDKFTVYNVIDINLAWKAFKALCTVYDWKTNGKDKVLKDIKRITI